MFAAPCLDRRSALRVGGVGLFGLGYPQLLQAIEAAKHKGRAKSVIFLFQWGGPGQIETFDPKPDAPDTVRGWVKSASTAVPGIHYSDRLPRVARIADKLCVVRCMRHSVRMSNLGRVLCPDRGATADRRPAAPRQYRPVPRLRQCGQ